MKGVGSEVDRSGYAILRRYKPPIAGSTVPNELGVRYDGELMRTHCLSPTAKSHAPPNTYSGQHGLGRFPLHTDLAHFREPPRYFVLRAIVGAADVITQLIDARRIIDALGSSCLARAVMRPRRPRNGAQSLLTLFDPRRGNSGMIRWDDTFIVPATDSAQVVVTLVREQLERERPLALSLSHPGDTLIVDNWRMLHGRSVVSTASLGRIVERTYLRTLN
jgi:L-asparagine oxygenase